MMLHIHLLDKGANINSKSQQILSYKSVYALSSDSSVRIVIKSLASSQKPTSIQTNNPITVESIKIWSLTGTLI